MNGGGELGTGEIVLLVALIGAPLLLAVINVLKGKYWFAVIGLFVAGMFGIIGAVRLAKPNSRWARRYGPDKMRQSKSRFPQQAAEIDPEWADRLAADPDYPRIETIDEWPAGNPADWDKTTRRAYKKQHGHWPDDEAHRE